jgi:hypothetical protein
VFTYIALVLRLIVFTLRDYYPGSTQWNYTFSRYVQPMFKIKAFILSFELSQGFVTKRTVTDLLVARRNAKYRKALTKLVLWCWPAIKLALDRPAQKICHGYENPIILVHLLSNPKCTQVSWIDHRNYDRVITISKHGTGFMSVMTENSMGTNTKEFRRRFGSLKQLSDSVLKIDKQHLHEISVALHNSGNVTL